MQTTLESKGWFSASRMKGCTRYFSRMLSAVDAAVLLALLISNALGYAVMRASSLCSVEGPTANLATTMCVAFICAIWATKQGARFLTRFGTPRTSLWLSTIASLIVWMAALLVATFVLAIAVGGVLLLLSNAYPEGFAIINYSDASLSSSAAYTRAITDSLSRLPEQALWLAEWCCVFVFIGACLRRNKWLTLGILLGVPMICAITMLIPAVRQTVAMLEEANQGQLMALGMKWLAWLSRLTEWVKDNWQLVQGLAALASLPLSWLIMRDTPQP